MLTTTSRPRSSLERWHFRLLATLLVAALAWPRLGATQVSTPTSRASDAPLTLEAAHIAARRASAELAAAREAVQAARGRGARPRRRQPGRLVWHRADEGGGLSNRQHITSLEQPLEIAGQRAARRDAARWRREAEEAQLTLVDGAVTFEVTRAFTTALATARQSALADQAARELALALRVSDERLAAGDISGYAHRRLRPEAARYAVIRAEAALERATARRALAAHLGVAVDSLPPLPDSLSAPPPARDEELTALVARAARSHPEVRIAELEFAAAIADARLASRERLPIPSLSAGYKREESVGIASSFSGLWRASPSRFPFGTVVPGPSMPPTPRRRQRDAVVTAVPAHYRAAADALDAFRVAQAQRTTCRRTRRRDAHGATAAQVAYTEGEITLDGMAGRGACVPRDRSELRLARAEVLIRRAALERAVGAPIVATPRD